MDHHSVLCQLELSVSYNLWQRLQILLDFYSHVNWQKRDHFRW